MQGIFFVIVSSAAAVVLPVLEYVAVSLLLLLAPLLPAAPCPHQLDFNSCQHYNATRSIRNLEASAGLDSKP